MRIRTAVLLCAGRGTRLWPLTLTRPKALVRVANKAIVDRVLETLLPAGIERVVVVVSPEDRQLREHIAANCPRELELDFAVQPEPRGLAHATACTAQAVGDEPFLLHLGDELLEDGVAEFVETAAQQDAEATILLRKVPDPSHFGVAVLDGDTVVEVIEKPETPPSPYALVGIYVFRPSIFDAITSTAASDRTGEVELTDAIAQLIARGDRVTGVVFEKTWFDVGRFETLLEANRFFLSREVSQVPPPLGERCSIRGPVALENNCDISDCSITGPCIIGSNCRLSGATIGPHVAIGRDCVITGSRVVDSIIGDRCRIADIEGGLHESVLGDDVHISGPCSTPLRMRLSDHSVVEGAPEAAESQT